MNSSYATHSISIFENSPTLELLILKLNQQSITSTFFDWVIGYKLSKYRKDNQFQETSESGGTLLINIVLYELSDALTLIFTF